MAKKSIAVIEQPTIIPEITRVVQSSKIDLNKAEMYAMGYAPLMGEVNEQNQIIKGLDKLNPEHAAVAKRASLDLGKILSRATARKKEDKELLLLETKHIDNLFNLVESTGRLGQADAKEIFEYGERVERERLDAVEATRITQLIPYGTNTEFVNIRLMTDEVFTRFLANEKLLFEAHAAELKKAEEARLEQERLAEQERERVESMRKSRTKLLTDAGFRFDGSIFWIINVKSVRIEELIDLTDEGFNSVLKSGSDRIKAEIEEQKKRDAELKRMQDAEKARLAKEAADKKIRDALHFKRIKELSPFNDNADLIDLGSMTDIDFKSLLSDSKEKHSRRIAAEKEQARKDEAARVEREKAAAEQALKDKELQALRDKQAAELKAAQDREEARLKAEQDAMKAPDQVKLRTWFEALKELQAKVPAFKSKGGKSVEVAITEGFNKFRSDVIKAAEALK